MNGINISKIKYVLRDRLRDDVTSIKKIDNKVLKIIDKELTKILTNTMNNYLLENRFKDFELKLLKVELKTYVNSGMHYEYEIHIINENMNVYDKRNIINELYRITGLIEYDPEFIQTVNDTFKVA